MTDLFDDFVMCWKYFRIKITFFPILILSLSVYRFGFRPCHYLWGFIEDCSPWSNSEPPRLLSVPKTESFFSSIWTKQICQLTIRSSPKTVCVGICSLQIFWGHEWLHTAYPSFMPFNIYIRGIYMVTAHSFMPFNTYIHKAYPRPDGSIDRLRFLSINRHFYRSEPDQYYGLFHLDPSILHHYSPSVLFWTSHSLRFRLIQPTKPGGFPLFH